MVSVSKALQDSAKAEVKVEKEGSLAFTDNVDNKQRVTVSDVTMRNIQSKIEMSLDTFLNQTGNTMQSIDSIELPPPCGVSLELSNDSYMRMMATDIARSATEAVMDSEEIKDYVTTSDSKNDQKARDVFAQIADVAKSIVAGVTALGGIWVIVVGGVILMALLFLPRILASFGGGGNQQMQPLLPAGPDVPMAAPPQLYVPPPGKDLITNAVTGTPVLDPRQMAPGQVNISPEAVAQFLRMHMPAAAAAPK